MAKKLWSRDDVQFIAHCLVIVALLVFLRPMFTRMTPLGFYEAPNIFWGMLYNDFRALTGFPRASVGQQLLFLLIPTALICLAGVKLRWEQWENGKALRNLVMTLLVVLAWAGATFDYNVYLDHGHFLDRLLLVVLTALCWKYPLAVPLAVKWVHVMLKESYVPIPADDFDFRAVHEVLVVFSVFVWVSPSKRFRSEHFLLLGVAAWASYYYAAGVAKVFYGPDWSWVVDNHLSNLSVGGHVRGWLGFISDETFLAMNDVARKLDYSLAVFTLVFELGALACFFINRRIAQVWFALAIAFNFGIFVMTGIFFWKWIATNAAHVSSDRQVREVVVHDPGPVGPVEYFRDACGVVIRGPGSNAQQQKVLRPEPFARRHPNENGEDDEDLMHRPEVEIIGRDRPRFRLLNMDPLDRERDFQWVLPAQSSQHDQQQAIEKMPVVEIDVVVERRTRPGRQCHHLRSCHSPTAPSEALHRKRISAVRSTGRGAAAQPKLSGNPVSRAFPEDVRSIVEAEAGVVRGEHGPRERGAPR